MVGQLEVACFWLIIWKHHSVRTKRKTPSQSTITIQVKVMTLEKTLQLPLVFEKKRNVMIAIIALFSCPWKVSRGVENQPSAVSYAESDGTRLTLQWEIDHPKSIDGQLHRNISHLFSTDRGDCNAPAALSRNSSLSQWNKMQKKEMMKWNLTGRQISKWTTKCKI